MGRPSEFKLKNSGIDELQENAARTNNRPSDQHFHFQNIEESG